MRLARTQFYVTVALSWIERGKTDAGRSNRFQMHRKANMPTLGKFQPTETCREAGYPELHAYE